MPLQCVLLPLITLFRYASKSLVLCMMVAVEVIVDVRYNDQNDANDIDDNVDGENGDDENMSMMRLSVRMLLNSQVTLRPLTPNLPSSY